MRYLAIAQELAKRLKLEQTMQRNYRKEILIVWTVQSKRMGPKDTEMNWSELVDQFGFDVHPHILRDRMAKRGFKTFIACSKPWISDKRAALRMAWYKEMLERYPTSDDWRHMRFSNETHFEWGPESQMKIIRQQDQGWRGHPDCI